MGQINIEESVFVNEKSYFKGEAFVPDADEEAVLSAVENEQHRLAGGEKAVLSESLEPAQKPENNAIKGKKDK